VVARDRKLLEVEQYFFNEEEEYVPEPISFVRRIRLASLETPPDSNSSKEDEEIEGGMEEESRNDGGGVKDEEDDAFLTSPAIPDLTTIQISENHYTTAFVCVDTKYVLVGKQRSVLRAAFGVWLGDGNPL
jgi:hypothetical protein